jgi:guanyl-specific ribonuclease Sa
MILGCYDAGSVPVPSSSDGPSTHGGHHHHHHHHKTEAAPEADPIPQGHVPEKVMEVLQHIDRTHAAPAGYEGGREFMNAGDTLPSRDRKGQRIHYQEWDVNPHVAGQNRGAQRLVTGSDGSAYYTGDHYRTFARIR